MTHFDGVRNDLDFGECGLTIAIDAWLFVRIFNIYSCHYQKYWSGSLILINCIQGIRNCVIIHLHWHGPYAWMGRPFLPDFTFSPEFFRIFP
jgi:hypothetical protein